MNLLRQALPIRIMVLLGCWLALSANPMGPHEAMAGQERDQVRMILIPEGPFIMGSPEGSGRPDERPQRSVYLDAFLIDQAEVTNRRYLKYLEATGHNPPRNPYGNGPLSAQAEVHHLPVVQVSWHDAYDYCQWAGKRLPTEAEWEKAARGTDGQVFPWGDSDPTPEHANFGRNWEGPNTLRPAGSHPSGSSVYGVLDMAGNVREWVDDWYHPEYYRRGPDLNPNGPETGILKVIRGGSWHDEVKSLKVAARSKGGFALKTDGIGFRCARSLKP